MKKGKINLTCLLLSGILSLIVYFFFIRTLFIAGWDFNIEKQSHWLFAWNKWEAGWVIKKPQEIMFFVLLVLMVPGWIVSWIITYLLPWKKILGWPLTVIENRKKQKLMQKSLEAAKGPADIQSALAAKKNVKKPAAQIKIAPDKIKEIDRLRGKKSQNIPAAFGTFAQAPTEHAAHQSAETFESEENFIEEGTSQRANGPTKEEQTLRRIQLWDNLANILEQNDVFTFREMKIGTYPTNIIAVTAESLFILSEGPAIGEEWTVEENDSLPVWKTGKDALASPLRPLVKARDAVRTYIQNEMSQYDSLNINACLVVDHGNITNPPELIAKLESWDISVLRMGSCTTDALPGTNALMEYIKSQQQSTQEINDAVAVAILDLMESEDED